MDATAKKEKSFFEWLFSNPVYYTILIILWALRLLSDFVSENPPTIFFAIFYFVIIGLFLLIWFAVYRMVHNSIKRKTFPEEIKGWKWLIYVIGLISGVPNLLFWIIQSVANFWAEEKEGLFSKKFHRITYIWGWVHIVPLMVCIIFLL